VPARSISSIERVGVQSNRGVARFASRRLHAEFGRGMTVVHIYSV
jgi:hypothetical protein